MVEPVEDDLVSRDEMGIDIKFDWHGKMWHELHRWPIARTLHPTKVAFEIKDEIIPALVFVEEA